MGLDDDIQTLAGVALFQGFNLEQLRLLAFGAESAYIPSGKLIFSEGSEADCAYVVTSGEIDLAIRVDDHSRSVKRVRKGAVLGELALVSPTIRPTSAIAVTGVELMRIDRSRFRKILEAYPDLAITLHQQISANLNELIEQIAEMAPRFDQE